MKENNLNENMDEGDISFSMMIDKSETTKNYNNIQTRTLNRWADDYTVTKCNKCSAEFGFMTRKHHCRKCGYIFCYSCSDKTYIIPNYVKIPKSNINDGDMKNPKRVCIDCYHDLLYLEDLKTSIEKIESNVLDINEIKKMREKSELHNHYINYYYLSQFREIQYVLPNHQYTIFEKNILWINRKLFIGHCLLITQLLKSVDYHEEHDKINELILILEEHDKIEDKNKENCMNLMCTRSCSPKLSVECCLMLLDRKILCDVIHQYAIKHLNNIDNYELLCYIPYLIENGIQSSFSIITDWIIDKCIDNLSIASKVYWYIQIGLSTSTSVITLKYNSMLISWKRKVLENIQNSIYLSEKAVNNIQHIHSKFTQNEEINMIEKNSVIFPTNPNDIELYIKYDGIHIIKSKTKPLIIPLMDNENKVVKNILYKKDDIRKDQIVMDIIRLMEIILKRNDINMDILTYDIQPTGTKEGFIEMINDSKTLDSLKSDNNKNKCTLLYSLLMSNKDSCNFDTLLNRFMKSCAVYSVITFLLGVGDRHSENMMFTSDGRFFHIDYGYILGHDPKGISTTDIRITDDIIDFLGGINGDPFKEFKKICEEIYDCLRRDVNTFTCLLNTLSYIQPSINPKFDSDTIIKEIEKRFVPGETYQMAQIQINNRIDNSTTVTYKYQIVDFLRRNIDVDEGFLSYFTSTFNKGKKVFQDLGSIFSNNNKN